MSAPTIEYIKKELGDNYVETNAMLRQCERHRRSKRNEGQHHDVTPTNDDENVTFNQDDSFSTETDEEAPCYSDSVDYPTDDEGSNLSREESMQEFVNTIEEDAVQATGHECCICLTEIEDEEPIGCSGTAEVHYWHAQCGLEYISTEIGAGRAFEGVRTQQLVDQQQDPLTSNPGELPCPGFGAGCDCAALPHNTTFRVLENSYDVSQRYMGAFRRVNIQEANAAEQLNGINADIEAGRNDQDQIIDVDGIYRRVTDALSRGYQMRCPNCHQNGQKDTACVHMDCPSCGTHWCYCCGRFRGQSGPAGATRCPGCDSISIFLQGQPDWDSYALTEMGEDAKTGALWEFHRRVMAYYVRRIKEETPPAVWEEFRQAHPTVLENTPTFGRHILWDDLESAEPPVFGSAVEDDLLWRLPPLQQEQQEDVVAPGTTDGFWEVFKTDIGKIWITACCFSLFFLILRLILDAPGLAVVADSLIALTSFLGFSYILVWCADFFASHPNHATCRRLPSEAFFVGKFGQPPLVSSLGRFGNVRVYFWVGSVALGSLLIGVFRELGSSIQTLQIVGTIILTLGLVCFALEFTIVNQSPIPRLQDPRPGAYNSFMAVSTVISLLIAVGAGLKTADARKVETTGVFLLCTGVGACSAEYFPRLLLGHNSPFWTPLDSKTVRISYVFSLSVTTGSALLWFGRSADNVGAFTGGIVIIVVGVLRVCISNVS